MDATRTMFWALCALILSASQAGGAVFPSPNFVVTAPTDEIARKVSKCAEFWRTELAHVWLGKTLPDWYKPCPISVKVGQIGAGGQTTFTFENGEVFGWKMQVQGTLERILDSVIPHEVNHTIFASHFRRPLPRWADEGAATLFEHESERARQTHLLDQVLNTTRRIPLQKLLTIREYPSDMQDVLTLYAEGYSLAEFLVGIRGEQGRAVYLQFLEDAHSQGWDAAIRRHYGYETLGKLEQHWTQWIVAGSPSLTQPKGQLLAQADEPERPSQTLPVVNTEPAEVIRGQSPAGELMPLAAVNRPLRVAAATGPDAAVLRETGSENPNPSDTMDTFRTREGGQRQSRPSLPPHTLSPTADGMEFDPSDAAYAFPSARR